MNIAQWWATTRELRVKHQQPIERAIALGQAADHVAFAFLGGYAAAQLVIDPSIGVDAIPALCATEAGGGHPRAVQTTLIDGMLNGTKTFVSGGSLATHLLVVAKVGEGERPVLRLARIAAKTSGVTVVDGSPLPIVPELPHGSVEFVNAKVDSVLEGDGYADYVKPFRTIEDIHVSAAVIACAVKVISERTVKEQLFASLATFTELSRRSAKDPMTHLALEGALIQARAAFGAASLSEVLKRDLRVMDFSAKARGARREAAWERLELPSP